MNELALFAGAGGGILGGRLLGWRTVCAVEWDAHARDVLVARQNDGCLEPFPIWDDVQTFDGRPWRGRVDVVSGGFPCQDISAAGKGAGITGARSGMWSHMARIIGEVRPRFVFVENSPVLTSRGLGTVLGDLAAMGYDAQWGVLGAIDAGAPHKRERIWIVADNQSGGRGERRERGFNPSNTRKSEQSLQELAHTDSQRELQSKGSEQDQWGRAGDSGEDVGDADASGRNGWAGTIRQEDGRRQLENAGWWESEPDVGRVAHGVAARVDRLRCIGNGQVPQVVKLAWEILTSNQKP
jgi:DNA (cytosine-5)-methyltransferase 1